MNQSLGQGPLSKKIAYVVDSEHQQSATKGQQTNTIGNITNNNSGIVENIRIDITRTESPPLDNISSNTANNTMPIREAKLTKMDGGGNNSTSASNTTCEYIDISEGKIIGLSKDEDLDEDTILLEVGGLGCQRKIKLNTNNFRLPTNQSELMLYKLLERANLLCYFDTFVHFGGDDVQQLCDAEDDEFLEIMDLVGMAKKPLHVRRLQKTLLEWKRKPDKFATTRYQSVGLTALYNGLKASTCPTAAIASPPSKCKSDMNMAVLDSLNNMTDNHINDQQANLAELKPDEERRHSLERTNLLCRPNPNMMIMMTTTTDPLKAQPILLPSNQQVSLAGPITSSTPSLVQLTEAVNNHSAASYIEELYSSAPSGESSSPLIKNSRTKLLSENHHNEYPQHHHHQHQQPRRSPEVGCSNEFSNYNQQRAIHFPDLATFDRTTASTLMNHLMTIESDPFTGCGDGRYDNRFPQHNLLNPSSHYHQNNYMNKILAQTIRQQSNETKALMQLNQLRQLHHHQHHFNQTASDRSPFDHNSLQPPPISSLQTPPSATMSATARANTSNPVSVNDGPLNRRQSEPLSTGPLTLSNTPTNETYNQVPHQHQQPPNRLVVVSPLVDTAVQNNSNTSALMSPSSIEVNKSTLTGFHECPADKVTGAAKKALKGHLAEVEYDSEVNKRPNSSKNCSFQNPPQQQKQHQQSGGSIASDLPSTSQRSPAAPATQASQKRIKNSSATTKFEISSGNKERVSQRTGSNNR